MTERKKGIEQSEKEWNPFTGGKLDPEVCAVVARSGPWACWAYRNANRLKGRCGYDRQNPFKPTFHEDRLDIPLKRKKPTIWACCFMGEIEHCKIPDLEKILYVMEKTPHHTYLLLTKDPICFTDKGSAIVFPDNVWFGTTINRVSELHRLVDLRKVKAKKHWASFEPLYEHMEPELYDIDGIAIGAETGPYPFQPRVSWVDRLIQRARAYHVPIVIKDNLKTYHPRLREWP